jgi:hypothetical protein
MKKLFLLLHFSIVFGFKTKAQNNYILYWGHYKAVLNEANMFQADVTIKYDDLEQIVYNPPHLWNGKAMEQYSFKIKNIPLQNADYQVYKDSIISLEQDKGTFFESNFALEDIALSNGKKALVNVIVSDAPKERKNSNAVYVVSNVQNGIVSNYNENNVHLTRGALSYRWGQYITLGASHHAYIRISDFWESVKERPELLQTAESKMQSEGVEVSLMVVQKNRQMSVYDFKLQSEQNYEEYIAQIKGERKLFKSNTLVFIEFHTTKTEIELAKHRLVLVADDDPRANLKATDFQPFTLAWGDNFTFTKQDAYLKTLKDSKGNSISADSNEEIRVFSVINEETTLAPQQLTLEIKGKKILDWSCIIRSENPDMDSIFYDARKGFTNENWAEMHRLFQKAAFLTIQDIKAKGFDFDPISVYVVVKFSDFKYKERPKNIGQILPPVVSAEGTIVNIGFDLEVGSIGNVKILDPEGNEIWVQSGEFSKGKHSTVAKEIKLEKGKTYRAVVALGAGSLEEKFSF